MGEVLMREENITIAIVGIVAIIALLILLKPPVFGEAKVPLTPGLEKMAVWCVVIPSGELKPFLKWNMFVSFLEKTNAVVKEGKGKQVLPIYCQLPIHNLEININEENIEGYITLASTGENYFVESLS